MAKTPTNIRLDPEDLGILARLAAKLGCSRAAIIRQALRAMARREKV